MMIYNTYNDVSFAVQLPHYSQEIKSYADEVNFFLNRCSCKFRQCITEGVLNIGRVKNREM